MFRGFAPALALGLCAGIAWAAASASTVVAYRERTGTKDAVFTWTLEKKDDIQLKVFRDRACYVNRIAPSGATLRWFQTTPQREITAYRRKNRIFLQGRDGNRQISKELEVDDAPWYQALTVCLRAFLRSDRSETRFWMIRPDTLQPVKMRAEKVGRESVAVADRHFDAWNVKVCLDGPLSIFWHAHYWYRLEDGLFLKYRGTHGPPGTPATTIEWQPPDTAHGAGRKFCPEF
jgi:hypothetical protein